MYSVYASTCAFLTFLTRHKQTTDYSIASDGQRPAKDLALLAKLHPVIPILCKDLMVYPVPLGFEMFLLLLWRKNPMEMEGAPIFQRPLKNALLPYMALACSFLAVFPNRGRMDQMYPRIQTFHHNSLSPVSNPMPSARFLSLPEAVSDANHLRLSPAAQSTLYQSFPPISLCLG